MATNEEIRNQEISNLLMSSERFRTDVLLKLKRDFMVAVFREVVFTTEGISKIPGKESISSKDKPEITCRISMARIRSLGMGAQPNLTDFLRWCDVFLMGNDNYTGVISRLTDSVLLAILREGIEIDGFSKEKWGADTKKVVDSVIESEKVFAEGFIVPTEPFKHIRFGLTMAIRPQVSNIFDDSNGSLIGNVLPESFIATLRFVR